MPATRTENFYDIVAPQGTFVGISSPSPMLQIRSIPQILMGILLFPEHTRIPNYKGMELHRTLLVRAQYNNDGVTIESDWVDESAWGRTEEAAKYDFLTSLGDRFISLSSRVGKLSRRDRQMFERLRILLFRQSR